MEGYCIKRINQISSGLGPLGKTRAGKRNEKKEKGNKGQREGSQINKSIQTRYPQQLGTASCM